MEFSCPKPSRNMVTAPEVNQSPVREAASKNPHSDTNTLIIANLPHELFELAILHSLRAHFAQHGLLRVWAPLAGCAAFDSSIASFLS